MVAATVVVAPAPAAAASVPRCNSTLQVGSLRVPAYRAYRNSLADGLSLRGALLRPLLDVLREERWLLDIELLVLLKRQGARALEEGYGELAELL